MLVDIEDGRATRLRGNPEHPVTRGFLCAKVTRYLDREYSPNRLLYPQKRVGSKGRGAKFERISWDEALGSIADRLKAVAAEFGGEAIVPYSYAGTMGLLNNASMDRRLFHRLGASRLDRTICSTTGSAGLVAAQGSRYSMDTEAFAQAKFVIAWGANIHGTNVHLWPFIVEARRAGAKFVVIDPIKTRTAGLADRHFAILPGSDLALVLGMVHVIVREGLEDADYVARYTEGFAELKALAAAYTPERVAELTALAAEDVEWLGREYATSKPAAIKVGYGVARGEFSGLAVQAIAGLPALVGAWRHAGGGLQLSTSQVFQFDRAALERPDLQPHGTRMANMSELGKLLTETNDPPVKALVVYNSNPAAVAPNQKRVLRGLAREDLFTVVLDHLQTDTADYADILLPATTFLEHTDLYFSWGHHYLQLARPVIEAPGEAKSNVEIFRLLGQRMFGDACFRDSEEEMIERALASGHRFMEGVTLERLEREASVRPNIGETFLPFAEGGFETPSGRLRFVSREYEAPAESRGGDAALRTKYPLEMLSSKNENSMNSTFGYRDGTDAETAAVHLHREDAGARGIEEGDRVRVFNDRGALLLKARVDGAVRQGVVRIPSTRWAKRSDDGLSVNALTSDRLADMGGGPALYNCLVQVEKCAD